MTQTPPPTRPAFNAYALPLPRRRAGDGRAAALSFIAHLSIAVLVLWRGAALFERGDGGGGAGPRGGGGGGGRPAVSYFALPAAAMPQAQDMPAVAAVSVPTLAVPLPDAVKIDVPLATVAVTAAAPVGLGAGTSGGPGQGPGTGGGRGTGTGTGTGADSGSGSGGNAGDIIPASPRWALTPPGGIPREARGRHEVRFWVTADGRVTRVEVTPPIKDASYRREFVERMMGFVFNPAITRDGRRVDSITTVTITL